MLPTSWSSLETSLPEFSPGGCLHRRFCLACTQTPDSQKESGDSASPYCLCKQLRHSTPLLSAGGGGNTPRPHPMESKFLDLGVDLESWPFINSTGACRIYSSAQGPSWNNDIITNTFDTWALFLDFLVWVELTVFRETKNWRGWVGLSVGEEEGLTQVVDRFRGRWQAIWLCQADENGKKKKNQRLAGNS